MSGSANDWLQNIIKEKQIARKKYFSSWLPFARNCPYVTGYVVFTLFTSKISYENVIS